LLYHFRKPMTDSVLLTCDGCGQLAAPEHLARRLRRLEWATRFRPLHIQTLLLGGISPRVDDEFLYSPSASIKGEARVVLDAVQISTEGKTRESLLTEFQKLGLMLTHVLECPLDDDVASAPEAIEKHLLAAVPRIRRSLKPKRVLLLSADLEQLADRLRRTDLGCPILPASAGTFLPSPSPREAEVQAFRVALEGVHA
jgi:hypothetical protein